MKNPFKRKKKSFYEEAEDDEDDTDVLTGFYGGSDPLAEPEEAPADTKPAGSFTRWEWTVFIIEGLLILYTIGAFLGVVPPF